MGQIQAAAVTSCMVAAATCAFAWALAHWVDNGGLRYEVPLVTFGTIWILTVTFAGGVAWALGQESVTRAKPRPPTPPGPTPPPEQPPPGGGTRPKPAPIQPPRPPRQVETTLVDLAPVSDVTQEIPLLVDQFREPVGYVRVPRHVPPEQLLSGDWRPRVSADAKGEDQ